MKPLLEYVHTKSGRSKSWMLELILVRDLKDTRNPTSMLVTRVDAGLSEETREFWTIWERLRNSNNFLLWFSQAKPAPRPLCTSAQLGDWKDRQKWGNNTVSTAWRTWVYPDLRGWMKFS